MFSIHEYNYWMFSRRIWNRLFSNFLSTAFQNPNSIRYKIKFYKSTTVKNNITSVEVANTIQSNFNTNMNKE